MWSWKLKSYNECVITHLSNLSALKMNEAETIEYFRLNSMNMN